MISNSALDLKLHRELLLCSETNCFISTRNLSYKQQVQFGISEGFRSHILMSQWNCTVLHLGFLELKQFTFLRHICFLTIVDLWILGGD